MTVTTGRGKADQDIIRAIGYITDDKYIASYYGVDVKRDVLKSYHVEWGYRTHAPHLPP